MAQQKGIKVILDVLKVLYSLKRNLAGDINEKVKGHDVGRSEVISIMHMYVQGKKNMGQLCQDVDLKSGSLTSVIDNLVAKGYAKREYDANDRRKIIVGLTGKGQNLGKQVCDYVEAHAYGKIGQLKPKDREEFFHAIGKLQSIVESFEKHELKK